MRNEMSASKVRKSQAKAPPGKTTPPAKLKARDKALQEEIVLFAESHSLAEAVAWLKTREIEVSEPALSNFLREYRQGRQFERNEATVEALLKSLKRQDPNITPKSIREAGQ